MCFTATWVHLFLWQAGTYIESLPWSRKPNPTGPRAKHTPQGLTQQSALQTLSNYSKSKQTLLLSCSSPLPRAWLMCVYIYMAYEFTGNRFWRLEIRVDTFQESVAQMRMCLLRHANRTVSTQLIMIQPLIEKNVRSHKPTVSSRIVCEWCLWSVRRVKSGAGGWVSTLITIQPIHADPIHQTAVAGGNPSPRAARVCQPADDGWTRP